MYLLLIKMEGPNIIHIFKLSSVIIETKTHLTKCLLLKNFS